ncbi:MAG: pseudouridine synthase, partial [Lachnospiraceae bacterium]|nr:pseudouridine synthase [Lachnospiraceae bacterium]
VTARSDDRYPTVMDYFKELHNENLSPVGRLDLETEGLLIITDDGAWNQLMTRPEHGKEKCYEFFVLGELTEEKRHMLEQGVTVIGSDKLTAPARLELTEKTKLQYVLPELPVLLREKYAHNRPFHPVTKGRITITEGRKRQIRRMMKTVGCLVIYLKRISMGDIVLDPALAPGEWKEIAVDKERQNEKSKTDTAGKRVGQGDKPGTFLYQ